MKPQEKFIKDLELLFKKYDVFFCVGEEWGGPYEDYLGRTYEIRSNRMVDGKLPIYIDDLGILQNIGISV